MIDFHCHLDLYPNPTEVIARCQTEKLYVLSVTTVPSAFEGTIALVPPSGRIRTALGLHPELAAARSRELPLFETLLSKTRYVGEVGLDGSTPHRATLEHQKSVLNDVLGMCAASGGRIMSLHSRGATGVILDLLSARPDAGKFVLHWYMGSKRQIERATELGCWFSVNPAMFLSERGKLAIAAMPKDKILPESDGPFGTIDGQVASPWHSWLVVKGLEVYWKETAHEVKQRLLETFRVLVSDPVECYE
jgi:TatD DNase family protein